MKSETRVGLFIISSIVVFIYLSIHIKVFRIDKDQYAQYKTYFDDTGGLDEKSVVRIAGVDVGWVDSIILLEGGKAEVNLMIHKKNRLSRNAYATIAQEGLIGTKVLEIDPGDPSTGVLPPGSVLSMPGKSPASVSDLLDQFRDIAASIGDIASSIKRVVSTPRGEDEMKKTLSGISNAAQRMSSFSEILDRTLKKNEENVDRSLEAIKTLLDSLNKTVPRFGEDFHSVTGKINAEFLPNLDKNISEISTSFSKEAVPKFAEASQFAGTAFKQIDDAAVQAMEALRQAGEVAEKINDGKGVIGKLINEEEAYTDLKKAIRSLREYVAKASVFSIDVDMHSEDMLQYKNTKGYIDFKISASSDMYYVLQIASDSYGSVSREEIINRLIDDNGKRVKISDWLDKEIRLGGVNDVDRLNLRARLKLENPDLKEVVVRKKDDTLFGFQFGKKFDIVGFRIGMFENTFGVAVDFEPKIGNKLFDWQISLECFDFSGVNRIDDTKPHIKLIHRFSFMKHIYSVVGVDDIISSSKASFFWGTGIRFSDDDLKYLFSIIPVGSIAKSG